MSAVASFVAPSAAIAPMIVQGASAHSSYLTEWQNSSGSLIASVFNNGSLYTSQNVFVNGNLQSSSQNASTLKPNANTNNTLNSGSIQISGAQSNQLPLLVKQAALTAGTITAATANGTTITYTASNTSYFVAGQTITITGVVSTGNPSGTAGSGFNLTGATIATASSTQFTVTNALSDTYTSGGTATIAAQSADITQWQTANGTVQAKITSAGVLTFTQAGTAITTPASGRLNIGAAVYATGFFGTINVNGESGGGYSIDARGSTSSGNGGVRFRSGNAANFGLVIQGETSQTGDLQRWNSSTGILTAITAAGTINFASGNTSATANTGAVALPALAVGFIEMQVAGTTVKVPYYAA